MTKIPKKLVSNLVRAGFACLFASVSPVQAEAVDTRDSKVSVFQQLDELRSKNAMLAEKLKNAELVNKLNDGGAGGFAVPSLTSATGGRAMGAVGAPDGSRGGSMPGATGSYQVKMVSTQKDRLQAVLLTPDGGRLNVRVGSVINGLGTIKSISINEVEVTAGKGETRTIPFVGETNASGMNGVHF